MGRHKSKPADAGASVLGKRVRQLRRARGLTLAQLGAAARLSHGFLSQVERDRARPSMSTLEDIATALGVGVADLVTPATAGFARHVRAAEAPLIRLGPAPDSVSVHALTGRNALMKMVENAGHFDRSERMSHAGEEIVYVVEGQVAVEVGGETFLLGPGDALNFDCSVEHTYEAVGEPPPRFLLITADPGRYADPVDAKSIYEDRVASSSRSAGRPGAAGASGA